MPTNYYNVALWPMPSFLYLEAQINGRNVSYFLDTWTTNSFIGQKFARELDLPTRRVDESINMRFAKGEEHETKELALYVTLRCGTWEYVERFRLCKMDKVDLILEDTFFETYTVYARLKVVYLVVCHDCQ